VLLLHPSKVDLDLLAFHFLLALLLEFLAVF
jgi:hypothetical protein